MHYKDINVEEFDKLEPQVTSSDPNVRKLARVLRIQRRIETLKKQSEPNSEEEQIATKTQLDIQILKSVEQLEKLLIEGEELITNVGIGNDAREILRRDRELKQKNNLIEQIENEVAEAERQYEVIENRWVELLSLHDPLDIHDGIVEQKNRCKRLIIQKNDMIATLRDDLRRKDVQFDRDQVQQKEDMSMLVNRVDKQIVFMKKAYNDELKLIELAVIDEKNNMVEASLEHWNELYKQRQDLEENNMEQKIKLQEQYLLDLSKNRVENEELFRETKITLEYENQILQQELVQMKAFFLLNGEKLNYNYQILKQREEENVIIKAQYKRLISKLRDELNSLRQEGENFRQAADDKSKRLTNELIKSRNSVFVVEKKADLLKTLSETKYSQVWKHNEDAAKNKLQDILTTDRIISEQLLGINWVCSENICSNNKLINCI